MNYVAHALFEVTYSSSSLSFNVLKFFFL